MELKTNGKTGSVPWDNRGKHIFTNPLKNIIGVA